jgi:O-succinylbenzoic acid--CoA ligase
VRVLGRADDVVVTGGENVVAAAVAEVLAGHPDLADVAVTGIEDPEWGQRVVAVVVARSASPPTLADVRDWCAERLPAPAAPRQLVVVTELPRLTSGKPDRLAVRRLAQQAATATGSQSTSPGSRS